MKAHLALITGVDANETSPEELAAYRNELLDVYSLYLETRIPAIKEEVIARAYLLHLHNPDFCFIV